MSTTPSVATATFATFNQMPLQAGTLDAIVAMGYETPTPIQAAAIGPFLAGRDVLAQARTGTGKTASFGIPIVDRLRSGSLPGIVGLVLVPTRELAIQVAEECREIAKASRLRVVEIYGGVGYGKQTHDLRAGGTVLLVATPGRLIDYLGQGMFKLDQVQILVLDEADRMLDMGFVHDVERILRHLPAKRQTGFYSATVPQPIQKLADKMLQNPVKVKVESGPQTTTLTEQRMLKVEKVDKNRALLVLLHQEQPERGIVFCRTKHLTKRLAEQLQTKGWTSVPLQGNMSQGQRERAMDAFRKGDARLLVATDVAARGIDVPELTHVINFDLPDEPEAYVHRIGRTGRMGRTGKAFTFVQSDEAHDWRTIERIAGLQIPRHDIGPLPTEGPVGPDLGKAAVNYKGTQGHAQPTRQPHEGGHHARKAPSAGPQGGFGRQGGRGPRAKASFNRGRASSGGRSSGGRSSKGSHGFSRDSY
ncbi:MAG: DEAD/DEAH box helicase [Candidatus Thermoplasmatota archaeon]